jgi:hypothetical protein
MRLLIRIVAVVSAVSVIGTVAFVADFAAAGGLRGLPASGLLGGMTILGWVITLVAGPAAAVSLWKLRRRGRRAGIILFGYGLAYYLVGLIALRSSEASTRQIVTAAMIFALPLVILVLPRTRDTIDLQEQILGVMGLLERSARSGATPAEVAAAERRLGVRIPDDLRALVSAFNGSDDGTPVEHGWVTFWPLQDWTRVAEKPSAAESSAMPELILFADHSIVSWWYAIELIPASGGCQVYLVGGVEPDKLVATSIGGFLQAILDDADALYGRRIPAA